MILFFVKIDREIIRIAQRSSPNYIVTHFVFQFQEILKPNYNSVDLAEVELVHDPKYDEPRHNDTELFRVSPSINLT